MRSAYYPHDRVQLTCLDKSRTKQSFEGETNINNIMRKYEKTGLIEHLNTHRGDYGNFLGYEDYHASLNRIRAAGESFMSLPPRIRTKFDNDPGKFMSFAQDPANLDELVEMGLAISRPGEDAPAPPGSEPPADPSPEPPTPTPPADPA